MPKKKTGFQKPLKERIDSPEAESFLQKADKGPGKKKKDVGAGGVGAEELLARIKGVVETWVAEQPSATAKKTSASGKKEITGPASEMKRKVGEPGPEILDEEFKKAVDGMIEAIKNADEKGWQTTSKSTALDYVEMFRHMIIIDGEED